MLHVIEYFAKSLNVSHSRSFEMTPSSRARASPYQYSIVTMALYCTFCKSSDVLKRRNMTLLKQLIKLERMHKGVTSIT